MYSAVCTVQYNADSVMPQLMLQLMLQFNFVDTQFISEIK